MVAYRKRPDGENSTQDDLLLDGQTRLEEDGQGNDDDHDVRRNVEDGIGDEVVRSGRTLG